MKHLVSLIKFGCVVALVLGVIGINTQFFFTTAYAASLTAVSDTTSSAKISTASSHVFKFTTATGIPINKTFIITFPSDFNLTSKTIGTVTLTHGASTGLETTETLAASPSTTAWGAVFSGTQNRILTLTSPSSSGTIAANDKVILTYTSANTLNATTPGSYTITLGGGASTAADSGSVTVPVLTDDTVAVSATVPQSLTFSLGSNTVALGTLSSSAAVTGIHTMTLGTNGTTGATISVAGTTLTSGSNTITACSAGCTSTTGSSQFGINLVSNSTPSVGAAPSGSAPIGTAATNYNVANTFRFVSGETVATASVPINTTTYTVSYLANITALTPAGSYTTTLTYSATANF